MIDNRPPMEATGDVTARRSDRTLLLSPGRRISMEGEVVTPPKGGRPAPETQGAPGGIRAVPFPDDFRTVYGLAVCVNRILNRR